jgi:hypothetical protein
MEKKSLINTLKSTKKAHVVTAPAKNEGTSSRKAVKKASGVRKAANSRHLRVL